MIPLKKQWVSPMTIKIAQDKELLDLAVKSGLKGCLIGFETVSQETLLDIKKGFNSVNKFYNAANILHDNGVAIMGCFVFGLDCDDKGCFERTIEFVNKANIAEKIGDHSVRLITIKQAYALFKYCIESEIYDETLVELYSFASILQEYITNTHAQFNNIQDSIGIAR